MITHIRVENFKSWKDSGEVKLAPLTGFFGTNSSGKSSLLQMLLLLKQTAERPDLNEVIFFGDNNSLVNLGNFREVIHGHKTDESLELGFGCTLQEPLEIHVVPKSNRKGNYPHVLVGDSFNFQTVIKEKEGKLNVEVLSYKALQWTFEKTQHREDVFLNREPIGPAREMKNFYGVPVFEESRFGQVLLQFSSSFEKLFDRVYYLGPTRVDPQRVYGWSGSHPVHNRQWNTQTVNALLSARVRKLKTQHQKEEVPIEDRVSHWLQEMELAHSFSLDWTSQGSTEYEVRIQKTPSSPSVTLVDMGYGLSQFLPVLVLCYYASEGSTLILEQPGIHLHPKVQSQLADLLIEVITERNLQVLIESHSEHLLNRLQRRIAEEKISFDKTALYFCRNDEGFSTIERLKMDEFGNIANWPENFFGDEMGDLFAMTEAQRKRQKRAEG